MSQANGSIIIATHFTDPRLRYFPDGAGGNEAHYARHLRQVNETSLSEGDLDPELIVRFTWLRAFEHPVVLRVDRTEDNTWRLHTKIGNGRGGYGAGVLLHQSSRELHPEQLLLLRNCLEAGNFWKLASRSGRAGLDGEQWILEARAGARYHYMDRWCPEDGVIVEVARLLLGLAPAAVRTPR